MTPGSTASPSETSASTVAVPPDDARVVWVDGRLTRPEGASVSALDHGLVVGDGVFESLRVTAEGAFATSLHLARLARSASGLGLAPPDPGLVRAAVDEVLDGIAAAGAWARGDGGSTAGISPQGARAPRPWVLRLTWTAGRGPLSSGRSAGRGTLVVAAAPVDPAPPTTAVVTVPWTRNEHSAVAGLKTTSYAENVVALHRAHSSGATEALMANTAGELCEGTGSNVAVTLPGRPGELLTPPLSSGCLAGVTRLLLLRWAREEGLPLREADVPFSALVGAGEVVLLSSLREVQQVVALDGRAVAAGEVGRRAAELFARRAAEELDPPV